MNIENQVYPLEKKYEKLLAFVKLIANRSCSMLDCVGCDALVLLREIKEDELHII